MQGLYLAALADFTLSGFILVVWRLRRDDRHTLYWAGSFFAAAIGVAATALQREGTGLPAALLASIALPLSAVLLWAGTRWRLGQALSKRHILWLTALSTAVIAAAGLIGSPLADKLAVLGMTAAFICSGWQLARQVPAMRIAAYAFVLRGAVLSTFLFGRKLDAEDALFYAAILIRAAFVIGLIHSLLSEAILKLRESEALRRLASDSARERLSSVIESLSDSIYVRDTAGCVIMANSACARMLGHADPIELIGRSTCELVHGMTKECIAQENEQMRKLEAASVFSHETSLKRHDGTPFPVERRLSRFRVGDETAGAEGVLVQMRDLTERKAYEEKLIEQVTVDEITQLPNRRMFMDRLHQALAMARRSGGCCAVMMIDLDHFKRINETRGHVFGDALLARAAERLRHTLREADTVARFGGDEFVVVLTEADAVSSPLRVEYAAQRVIEAFQSPFSWEEMQVVTTASVGIAMWPTDGDDADTLLRNADTAMYEIKKSTRNGFCLFNREMNLRVQNILRIDAQLRGALIRQQFRVVFQPIVDAISHRMMKVEALLRWRSSTLGDVPPDQFIPVAEETGQIGLIGAWVLEEACHKLVQLQALRQDGAPLIVSVNVSARQLVELNFVDLVDDILRRTGVAPAQLELELTERIFVDDNPVVLDTIRNLRALGISLSLDDFGTGYSSLSYLTRFPLDTIKLDRSFVRDIETNPQSLQLAAAVIALCSSLGLALVAEGVETRDQADLLRGCRYLQGYYFGQPVSAEDLALAPGFQCEAAAV